MFGKEKFIALMSLFLAVTVFGGTPWSQFRGAAAHDGRWDGRVVPSEVQSLWSAGLGLNSGTQVAVSEDGTKVFAYGDNYDGSNSGVIYALHADNGTLAWPSPITVAARVDMWSTSSPICHDGYVYWTGSDGSGKFKVYKINAETAAVTVWANDAYIGEIVNNSPTIAAGTLFISTYGATLEDMYAYIARHYAIDLSSGQVIWSNADGGQGQGCLAYNSDDQVVYQSIAEDAVVDNQTVRVHKVRAYRSVDGAVMWTGPFTTNAPPHQSAIAYDPITYSLYLQDFKFGSAGNSEVYKILSGNGYKAWTGQTPAAGTGAVVVGFDAGAYACVDWNGLGQTCKFGEAGNLLTSTSAAGGWAFSPALADGYLFVSAQYSNDFYILNASDLSVQTTLVGSGPAAFGKNELYTIGSGGSLYAYRLSQPQPMVTVQGKVTLADFVGTVQGRQVRMDLLSSSGDTLLETHLVQLDAAGNYAFETGRSGSFILSAKAFHWLRENQPLTISGGGTADFDLINGDCDGDNEVTTSDLATVLLAMDAQPGDPNWDFSADVDGDQEVTTSDLSTILMNMDKMGD